MNRRLLTILLPLAASTLAAGCTTFSDNDAVARVNDVELSADSLAELVGAPDGVAVDANAARVQIQAWVQEEVGRFADPTKAPDAYRKGVQASGSVCIQVAVVDTEEIARNGVADLEGGVEFATFFAESNVNPAIADEGRLGCAPGSELPFGEGDPLIDSLLSLSAVSPYSIATLSSGTDLPDLFTVSRFVPYDELLDADRQVVADSLTADALGIDIYVDPRYGTYDSLSGSVLALG